MMDSADLVICESESASHAGLIYQEVLVAEKKN